MSKQRCHFTKQCNNATPHAVRENESILNGHVITDTCYEGVYFLTAMVNIFLHSFTHWLQLTYKKG